MKKISKHLTEDNHLLFIKVSNYFQGFGIENFQSSQCETLGRWYYDPRKCYGFFKIFSNCGLLWELLQCLSLMVYVCVC